MLNHTYTSVKNANLVDCGKKQHIPSQPSPLLKDNFLGEFRTELDKKKVLANLGIVTDLLLEWEYIKGDIGKNTALMQELDSRTRYVSEIDGFQKSIADGIKYLETVIGGEEDAENKQNERLTKLETDAQSLLESLEELKTDLTTKVKVDISKLQSDLETITTKVDNITELIKVSSKEGNALVLLSAEDVAEGETPGLFVPDLSKTVSEASAKVETLQTEVATIKDSLDDFVTKEALGGDVFDFVDQPEYDAFVKSTGESLANIERDLENTVKTGEDGHVDTLYVNKISKDNSGNIVITDSFSVDSGIPLDVRCVVDNLDELKALPYKVCYPGMGVVVNSLSSLYILRKPEEGVVVDQEYVSNIYNWKCPEDLVTVAITRQEYESLEEVNPNVFYYIYEDEIKLTQEPVREDFYTDEEFQEAWQAWTDSLKVLSQEYMSASWGVDIENKLSQKASVQSVLKLSEEISEIKGGEGGISLESINKEISNLKGSDEIFEQRLDEILTKTEEDETGRLVVVETQVAEVNESLKAYVTKDELADLSNDFNFVKPEDYAADKLKFETDLAKKVTTEELVTNTINLSENTIVVKEGVLQFNSESLAKSSEVPNIEVMSQSTYDSLETVDDNTYYYTYDEETIYVTQTELNQKLKSMQDQINALSQTIGTLEKRIDDLQALLPVNE